MLFFVYDDFVICGCDLVGAAMWPLQPGVFQLYKSLGERATGRYTEYRGGRSSGVYIQRKST